MVSRRWKCSLPLSGEGGWLSVNAVDTAAGMFMTLGSGTILMAGVQPWQLDWSPDFDFG